MPSTESQCPPSFALSPHCTWHSGGHWDRSRKRGRNPLASPITPALQRGGWLSPRGGTLLPLSHSGLPAPSARLWVQPPSPLPGSPTSPYTANSLGTCITVPGDLHWSLGRQQGPFPHCNPKPGELHGRRDLTARAGGRGGTQTPLPGACAAGALPRLARAAPELCPAWSIQRKGQVRAASRGAAPALPCLPGLGWL